MKLYRHYKNKFYKLLGHVRHSETGEELALYETRYESPGGKTWVRPAAMFHEEIEHEGQRRPRFEQVVFEYRETDSVGASELKAIAALMERAFGQWDPKWFHGTFDNQKKFHLILAYHADRPAAFKLAYERDPRELYSWLGGVDPAYRGVGLAGELMKRQHDWASRAGYEKIGTKTMNRFREMLQLNIRHGFDIIGTHMSDDGGLKIVLEKRLKR